LWVLSRRVKASRAGPVTKFPDRKNKLQPRRRKLKSRKPRLPTRLLNPAAPAPSVACATLILPCQLLKQSKWTSTRTRFVPGNTGTHFLEPIFVRNMRGKHEEGSGSTSGQEKTRTRFNPGGFRNWDVGSPAGSWLRNRYQQVVPVEK